MRSKWTACFPRSATNEPRVRVLCSAQECRCCSAEAAFLLENLPLRSLSMKRFRRRPAHLIAALKGGQEGKRL
jgi:hypothetical protein